MSRRSRTPSTGTPSDATILVPFDAATRDQAEALVQTISASKRPTILAGPGISAVRAALQQITTPYLILHDATWPYEPGLHDALLEPLQADTADAVFGSRSEALKELRHLPDRALGFVTNLVTEQTLQDPLSGLRAFRTEALRAITLSPDSEDLDAELVVKLSAQLYRFAEVPLSLSSFPNGQPLLSKLARARTLLRYATVQNASDNQHEGYNTLIRMDGAKNYNEWLGERFRPHLGRRVLEIGSGIGTITKQIEAGRELLIALEVDRWYVDRLKNAFRHKPHVRPYLSDVALADWKSLKAEKLDSILLSNVLEHIPDDGGAVRRFREILQPDGKLVLLVPALQQLFGAIDEAVGHHRRYSPSMLREVLESNGFVVEKLEWMNLAGVPGWFLNGRIFKRRTVPNLQLRLYDAVAPMLARAESKVKLPIGLSLFAVARAK